MKKVFKLELNGSWFIDESNESIIQIIQNEMGELELNEPVKFKISLIEMSEDEYNNLPEFDGF